jgi:hypothetical protein
MRPGEITPAVSITVDAPAIGCAAQLAATHWMVFPTTSTSPGASGPSGVSTVPRKRSPPVPMRSIVLGGAGIEASPGSMPASPREWASAPASLGATQASDWLASTPSGTKASGCHASSSPGRPRSGHMAAASVSPATGPGHPERLRAIGNQRPLGRGRRMPPEDSADGNEKAAA